MNFSNFFKKDSLAQIKLFLMILKQSVMKFRENLKSFSFLLHTWFKYILNSKTHINFRTNVDECIDPLAEILLMTNNLKNFKLSLE